jgi:prevent-host-death family protein
MLSGGKRACYGCYMRTISHRELRNNSAEVLRDVEHGESFSVTNRGEVIARLIPAGGGPDLRCVRSARGGRRFADLPRRVLAEPSSVVVDELRAER